MLIPGPTSRIEEDDGLVVSSGARHFLAAEIPAELAAALRELLTRPAETLPGR